ncbi:MAG: NADPH:quinone oxidoreductase family protein [Pseudomonadales bacterium]|nr:NADPH:quinone oxidoreductase family protein [Pseudomonadales bacterium]MCP5183617.1 NADPH:quinone oxidoreductase family protein [Pseudomonadales bacterium]
MKAVYCEKLSDIDDLVVREVEAPGKPGAGELRIDIKARGVAFTDVLMTRGEYQVKPPLPFVVGGEGAGIVTDVGDGVAGFAPGDKVLTPGGCAETVLTPATRVTKLPPHVDLVAAASFRANYHTAYYGLQRGRLQPGETLLVHGAAGGVGLAAVDVGKLMGARVIATASTPEKLAVARELGADHAINYSDGFREEVKALTGGRGADVIYDPVGADVFDESMRCIAPFGRILIVGFVGGRPGLAKTNHLLIKDAEVIGYTVGALARHDPAWAARNNAVLVDWLATGKIRPYVSHVLPMEQTTQALRHIVNREVIGKAVLVS